MRKKGFTKGDPNINRAGRKKGVPNKTTEELRQFVALLIENNMEQLQEDFSSLEPFQRLTMVERFLKYVLPPITKVEVTQNDYTYNKDTIKHIRAALGIHDEVV